LSVVINVPVALPAVQGNAKQLEVVLVNLVKNAIEAMAEKTYHASTRELRIRVRQDPSDIVLELEDTGPGIKAEDQSRLFEPYFSTKGAGGTGLGLYLARRIMNTHGGAIAVQSSLSGGAKFIVSLPIRQN
jgi:signal transduction histidine kinase